MATTQEFTISDTLWARLAPLLPVHTPKPHPLGCHRPRVPDREALTAIFFVLRTGCQLESVGRDGLMQGFDSTQPLPAVGAGGRVCPALR